MLRCVQKIVVLLIETLEAEFHDDLFPQWWEVFDLYAWQNAAPNSPAEQALCAKFNKLCRSRGWNEVVLARQWAHIQEIALRKFRARPECERASDGVSAAPDVSAGDAPAADAGGAAGRGLNRRCWSEAMVEAESAHGQLPLGKALYAWYKGISDSTCDVERLIKTVKQHIKVKHADIGSLLLRDAVTIDAFGPQKKEDLATRSVCPDSRSVHLVPTEFLKRCHALWVQYFGRRYCVNSMARSD